MHLPYSDFLTENLPILNPHLPQKSENVRPHSVVTLLKMRSHYSHSSRENATPSSGTTVLASCKGVPPPPGLSVPSLLLFLSLASGTGRRNQCPLERGCKLLRQGHNRFATRYKAKNRLFITPQPPPPPPPHSSPD